MMRQLRGIVFALTLSLVMSLSVPSAVAQDAFKVTLIAKITSVQVVGGTAFIEAEARGASRLLGRITAEISVAQALTPPGECDPATTEETWSTAAGTLEVETEVEVCGRFISGVWMVTGGTSGFTGDGTVRGVIGGQGNVVVMYEGTLMS